MNSVMQLFLNPTIISLCLGIIIGLQELFKLPRKMMYFISVYLVFTIGFKGGACLGVVENCTPPLIALTLVGIIIGFIQPFINNLILQKTTQLDPETNIVVATEYGSISIVTFMTAISFLSQQNITYDNFMMAMAGIMEIPAIFAGLILLQKNKFDDLSIVQTIKDIVKCEKVSAIFIGFFAGIIFRVFDYDAASSIIINPFNLMLIFFMFDIGISIGLQKKSIRAFSKSMTAFALYMPFINGTLALFIAKPFVDSLGSAILFTVLIASASYIAVPAIMRSKARGAKEAIYLPMSLGITLPFNVLIGLPYFFYIGSFLYTQ